MMGFSAFSFYSLSPDSQPQWVYIKLDSSDFSMKHVDIKREEGTMNILNRSVQIRCDGHYLFFLKGTIHLQGSNDSLMLRVKKRLGQQEENLLDVPCSVWKTEVQQATVSKLKAQDEIILKANRSATVQDLSLWVFMLTPHSYCCPEKS